MKKIIWGVLLLAAAVLLVLMELGVGFGAGGGIFGFSTMDIVVAAVLLAIGVNCCIDRNWEILPFVAAVLFCALESDIARLVGSSNSNLMNNGVVFLCAVIASVGISLLSSPLKKRKKKKNKFQFVLNGNDARDDDDDDDDKHGKYDEDDEENCVKMSSASKYFDCSVAQSFCYEVKMGDANLYFTNTENVQGEVHLEVSCYMGNMDVYVPHTWRIKNKVSTRLGAISEPEGSMSGNGPLLVIEGDNKMGNIDIHYI